ncbi:MAG: hypothetical protein KDE27_09795 [Planctomycetes bacterium]|nr:hypothetical protein [Planctomycetota bacterium]
MHIKTLVLAAVALGGTAVAQCGSNQLTTPPNFISDNGGAVGGAVYFTLDVLNPGGIRICGIDVNTSTTGAAIRAGVYLHQSITDVNQLTTLNETDWCVLGRLDGTANGVGVPSPCTVVNATQSIDLPAGQHLLAIGNGNIDHDYTNGTGLNQVVADANLRFTGGKAANAIFAGPLYSPRIANLRLHYDVGAPSRSPCGVESSSSSVGTSCAGGAVTLCEQFDFGNPWDLSDEIANPMRTSDVLITAAAGAVTVTNVPGGTGIVPPIAPDLGLGDDETTGLIPLGFELSAFGVCADAIAVDSNGCVWLGIVGISEFDESLTGFESQGARVAVCWNDFRSQSGGGPFGSIHVDQTATETLVTWNGVEIWGTNVPVTFQCSIRVNAITCRYLAASAFEDSALVGFHNGFATTGTTSYDITAGPVMATGGVGLTLACPQNPTLGGAMVLELDGVPTGGIAAVLATIGSAGVGVPLPQPLFAAGCTAHVPQNAASLGVILGGMPCNTYGFTIPIPNTASFAGLPFAAQGVGLDVVGNVFVTSNAIDALTGNF